MTINAAIWLIVIQWISAALGGYIAGRLRSRWHGTHEHEVFFRDTAHGLITWSVATVFVAAVLTSTLSSAVGFGAHATLAAASGASVSAEEAYATDVLVPTGRRCILVGHHAVGRHVVTGRGLAAG